MPSRRNKAAAGPRLPGGADAADGSRSVVDVEFRSEAGVAHRAEALAEEVPISLVYNGEPHVVMMATPADLEDFARGFSLTEGIVASAAQIASIRVAPIVPGAGGIAYTVEMRIPDAAAQALAGRRRNLQGRTGCGLCGAQEIDEAVRAPRRVPAGVSVSRGALQRALQALRAQQPLNAATGATHAAAWATPDGLLCAVREDVGRHNALDKLIGHLVAQGTDLARGFLVITSRASYEMVLKAAMAGMPIVVAISAPTAYAVRVAEEAGLTLAGFARGDRHTVYACPARIVGP